MVQTFIQGIMILLLLFVVPFLTGNGVCSLMGLKKTVTKNYFLGFTAIWALFQLVTVPLVLIKASFAVEVIVITAVLVFLCVLGIHAGAFPLPKCNIRRPVEFVSLMLACFGIAAVLLCTIFMQHTDWDDSRFVVNAVDMVRTNRMFLTNPMTGEETYAFIGELKKDVTAPWAVYIAYCAKMTGVFPTVMAHTVLPIVLLICAFCVYWQFAEVLFKEDIFHKSCFLYLVILLNLYGHFSVYRAETFLLTRLWQGKAVVAGIGIPAMFLLLMWIYEKKNRMQHCILLLMMNLSVCLMSGMGTIIGAMMIGCTGLVYGIRQRNRMLAIGMWAICLPNMIYYFIHACL